MRGKVLEAYRCFDAKRSNICVVYKNLAEVKNIWRTLYARLYIVSLIISVLSFILSFGILLILYLAYLLFFVFGHGPLVRKRWWVRLLFSLIAWGSFAAIMAGGITVFAVYIMYPLGLANITSNSTFASFTLISALSFSALMIVLAVMLKPVTLVEVEKDPRKHRLTWWLAKRYYILKLFWNL